jgi:hypothetical protein
MTSRPQAGIVQKKTVSRDTVTLKTKYDACIQSSPGVQIKFANYSAVNYTIWELPASTIL